MTLHFKKTKKEEGFQNKIWKAKKPKFFNDTENFNDFKCIK